MLKKLLLITCLSISFSGLNVHADIGTNTTYHLDHGLIPIPKCILMPNDMGQNSLSISTLEKRLHTIANEAKLKLPNAKLSLTRFLKNPELIGWWPSDSISKATYSKLQSYASNNPSTKYTETYITENINTPQNLYRYLLNLINVLTLHPTKSTELKMRLADLKAELNNAIQGYIPMD